MSKTRKPTASKIEFACMYCGNEMSVAGTKAGSKGRCPKCRMVITIPKASMNEPEDFDPDAILQNKKLSKLYRQFAEKNDSKILDQLPIGESDDRATRDTLILSIRQSSGRKQRVGITTINVETSAILDEKSVLADLQIASFIGFVGDNHVLCYAILRAMHASIFSASIEPNGDLMLRAFRKLDNMDFNEFEALIFELAKLADNIEEQIIGTDEH